MSILEVEKDVLVNFFYYVVFMGLCVFVVVFLKFWVYWSLFNVWNLFEIMYVFIIEFLVGDFNWLKVVFDD